MTDSESEAGRAGMAKMKNIFEGNVLIILIWRMACICAKVLRNRFFASLFGQYRECFYLSIGPKIDNHYFLQDSGSCSKDGHCDGTMDPETKSDLILVSIITPTRQKTQSRHSLLYDCFQYQTYPNK